ncbi:M23 family metallopeptidase [Maricaulaceae bacterium EIL42A08]|nr:M23 family metallopeptidase [Maricaulaceae bacterium EIL42A08]
MRFRFLICVVSAAAVLAACSSSPRAPAPITRGGASSGAASCAGDVVVRRGDTLYSIARRCGVSTQDIARENRLSPPYTLNTGQRLRMPGPAVYTVRRGDNLYRIGLAHGMTTQEIASLNGIRPPYDISPGQQLRVRGPVREVEQASNAGRPGPSERPWTAPTPGPNPAPPLQNPVPTAQVGFAWPLNGPVIGRFGETQGTRLNGIRIQARVGEPVRAAAAGEVVYAGNELQGYGELVLIRHENRWVTAYGLNTEILVQEGQRVAAGQHIANAGGAGGGEVPALHFEIRRGVTPVNPEQQLPRR